MTSGLLVPPRVETRATARGRVPWTFGPLTLRLLALGLLLLLPVWIDRRAIALVAVWDASCWPRGRSTCSGPPARIVAFVDGPVTLGVPQTCA